MWRVTCPNHRHHHHHHHRRRRRHRHRHHLSLSREGHWDTTDDTATSFLHFPWFPLHSGTRRTPGLSIP